MHVCAYCISDQIEGVNDMLQDTQNQGVSTDTSTGLLVQLALNVGQADGQWSYAHMVK